MDKKEAFALPKPVRPTSKRTTQMDVPTTSRKNVTSQRETYLSSRRKTIVPNKLNISRLNQTVIDDSMCPLELLPFDSDTPDVKTAYDNFVCSMLEECLIDEKIEKEETQMEVHMSQLADRFQKTMDQLDKTNKRLKDISFVAEQKRLLDLRSQDTLKFYDITENNGVEEKINDLITTEEAYLNKLHTKNVDFGYDNNTGHKQLLDVVNEAIEGLENIKKNSNLDANKFEAYEKFQTSLATLEKDRYDYENSKAEFETKFPEFSENLLKQVSEKVATFLDDNDDS